MVPHLQRTYDAAQAAKLLARGIGKQVHAPVTLGVAGAVSEQLGQALSQVMQGLPGFQLSLVKADATSLLQSLLKGEVDAAVLPEPGDPPERLDTIVLSRQALDMVAPIDCPVAQQPVVQLCDLAQLAWIEGDALVASEFTALCAEAGLRPEFRHSANLEGDLVELIANGLGCAWLPAGLTLPDRVRRVAVEGVTMMRTTVFATVSGRKRSVATEALVRAIRARAWG
jgi:DNA-binding transcriptional LysR family regulator